MRYLALCVSVWTAVLFLMRCRHRWVLLGRLPGAGVAVVIVRLVMSSVRVGWGVVASLVRLRRTFVVVVVGRRFSLVGLTVVVLEKLFASTATLDALLRLRGCLLWFRGPAGICSYGRLLRYTGD